MSMIDAAPALWQRHTVPQRLPPIEAITAVVVVDEPRARTATTMVSVERSSFHVERHISASTIAVVGDDAAPSASIRSALAPCDSVIRTQQPWAVKRLIGVAHAVARTNGAGIPPDRLWVTLIDAGDVVPSDWFEQQLHHAADGAVAVRSVPRPDGSATPRLGFRIDAYLAARAWRPMLDGDGDELWKRFSKLGTARGNAELEMVSRAR